MKTNLDACKFLESADINFLRCLTNGDAHDFVANLQSARSLLEADFMKGELSAITTRRLFESLSVVRDCAKSFLKLKAEGDRILQNISESASSLVQGRLGSAEKELHKADPQGDLAGTKYFRQWFIEHIAHPFPSSIDKHHLAEVTNKELEGEKTTYMQCQLWFINTRRRSQWTLFYRTFALNRPERMEALCEMLKGGGYKAPNIEQRVAALLLAWELTTVEETPSHAKQCVNTFKQMISWIEQKPLEEEGTWLDDAIAEGKKAYNEARRKAKEHRRRIREMMPESMKEEGVVELDPRKQMIRTKRKSIDSTEGQVSPKRSRSDRMAAAWGVQSISPRLPPALASTSRNARTFSGSSASSLGSLPSLIDAGSSSYESVYGVERLQAPTVQTTAFADAGWQHSSFLDAPQ